MVRPIPLQQISPDCRIMEVHVAILRLLRLLARAVALCASSKLFEFHYVAGERASLIGEDVVNLPELLVQVA